MPVPIPIVPLEDICSVVYANTLYTYSSTAFQALEFTDGEEWVELSSGMQVEGGVCVGTTPEDPSQAAFYVVGGTSDDPDYQGLQRFTYSTGKWENITLPVAVTQSRTWHGATYINSTDSILMYAGTQDGSQQPSSQTFTINLSDNHTVISYESTAPPTVSPMLLPWSDTHAVLFGGAADNTKVMLFSPLTGWTDSGSTLSDPLPAGVSAVLAGGDDGCKNLYTFDMSTVPNMVNRTVLLDGTGQAVLNSQPVSSQSQSDADGEAGVERRELTLDHWPDYNSTLAPQETRSNYALAQDSSGLVVIAGGNEDDVLCMFNTFDNAWTNASALFSQEPLGITSLPSSSADPSPQETDPTQSTSTDTANADDDGSSVSPNVLLGAVLGSVLGVALILIVVLFLLRKRKQKLTYMEAGHNRRASGAAPVEKDDLGFANDFKSPNVGATRGHQQQGSQSSFSSMAILMGKMSQPTKQAAVTVKRKTSLNSNRASAVMKTTISRPTPPIEVIPQLATREVKGISFAANVDAQPPKPPGGSLDPQAAAASGGIRRSSGWNKYWSGGSALNILGINSKRNTQHSDSSSRYSDPRRVTQDSATVPHLRLDPHDRVPTLGLQRVNSGSPTIAQYSSKVPLKEGMVGQIERPQSTASSDYSSGIPASVQDAWDPTASQKPWGSDRAPSSAYSQPSMYPTSLGPSTRAEPQPPLPKTRHVRGNSVSQQPQLTTAEMSTDMSWLNLGGEQSQGR